MSAVKGKAGTVYYQLCHKQKNRQISSRIYLYPDEWNADRNQVALFPECRTHLLMYQRQIDGDLLLLKRIVRELENRSDAYTLSDIIEMFRAPNSRIMALDYLNERIVQLKVNRKLGTARNYQRTANSFFTFLGGTDVSLTMLDERLVMRYNDWLNKRKVVRNTISFYMRTLRSVYNHAVRQRIVEQTYPFRNVYTGVDHTRKRAVDEHVIVRLQKLDLSFSPSLSLARDLFVFSYCTRGMAFVDIAFLRKQEVRGGAISYSRRKTGQNLNIHIEPCIEKIIRRYEESTGNSSYVFPMLTSENAEEAFTQYQTALGYYNRKLKELAKLTGIKIPLSSYTPRHTWATTARNHNVPLSVISAGMGHSSENTTQIYLATLDNSIIDQANRNILAALNTDASI